MIQSEGMVYEAVPGTDQKMAPITNVFRQRNEHEGKSLVQRRSGVGSDHVNWLKHYIMGQIFWEEIGVHQVMSGKQTGSGAFVFFYILGTGFVVLGIRAPLGAQLAVLDEEFTLSLKVVAGCSSELYACVPVVLNNLNQIAVTALLFYTSSSLA
ncbi:hypothetical protein CHARACLAT_019136 [Characodon lateralis]|uniref:Uncharacterized protein n=1 Tax=Characodon lateralis TaxID=208331 RepID=A0ABU7D823_9TELE|nr:hypothetical protein [Characodon lateralis]